MAAFGSGNARFATSTLTGYGGRFRPNASVATAKGRKLTTAEERSIRFKLRAAAYTDKGVDWRRLFSYYDTDGSGEISVLEFKRLLRSDAKISVSQLSDISVRALFSLIDLDGSGEMDVDEFLAWVNCAEEPNPRDEGETKGQHQKEWGAGTGYGRISPRKLHSPSQRRYDLKQGWVVNNDENSEAEAAVLRRQGSSLATTMDKEADATTSPSSSPPSATRPKKEVQPETTKSQLTKARAALKAVKMDYAKQEKVLQEALQTIAKMTAEKEQSDMKLKEQRRTIIMMNRNGKGNGRR